MRKPEPVDTLAPFFFVICLLFSITAISYLHKDDHLKDILLNDQTIYVFKNIGEEKKINETNNSHSKKRRNYSINKDERNDNDLTNGLPVIKPFNSYNNKFRYRPGIISERHNNSSYDSSL